ncbi:TonB-dependent receptor plug domain-containing protein [Coprobacter fastidiosus]|uniref:TonB-dependent receptor plug domain-containing protein n=1 Tax=Coprobacter fastidiosus TaxID=1099853 RepID=UPI003207AEA0
MKRIKSLLILCLFTLQLIAQETVTLKGVITAASDGSPIIGASVIIKGETKGTISDINGNFTLLNVKLGSTLKVTYIGMNPITIKVTSANVKIKMESSATELNEIVTIGYGSVRKSDLTSSVSSVKGESLTKTALTSFDQGLQGRIAGVEVVQADATPGGVSYIQIRGVSTMMGSTEPLYVIDGIPFNIQSNLSTTSIAGGSDTNPLASISPSDIESIEILKDAPATAIYGSQGANGVVLIQTKQGSAGKAKISFATNQSVAVLSKKNPGT